jgi:(p)ppGpp synthase/HD superfamily hydrolase
MAHGSQTRKYTGEPYIVHPVEVARLVASAGFDEEVVAAAYLHDVIEDCGIDKGALALNFGCRVARLVDEVSDRSRPEDGNRALRKMLDRAHLAQASPEGKSIKLADLIDNTRSIVERDPNFAQVYLAEKRNLLPVLQQGNQMLYRLAYRTLVVGENEEAFAA